jgi:hypothetical protein
MDDRDPIEGPFVRVRGLGGARTIRPTVTGRVILGLVVMWLGVLWTLDNLDILDSEPILRFWPVAVIAVGMAKLLGIFSPRNVIAGSLFTVVGMWLLLNQLDVIHVGLWTLWPLALVAIGIGMLSRTSWRPNDPTGPGSHANKLSSFAFMSGVDRKVASNDFRGGDATAVMGGVKLDLKGAKPVEGGAILDLLVCWGGIEIYVPDTWKVVNEATVVMGGLEDQSKIPPAEARDVLILRGLVIMGGVEIKN